MSSAQALCTVAATVPSILECCSSGKDLAVEVPGRTVLRSFVSMCTPCQPASLTPPLPKSRYCSSIAFRSWPSHAPVQWGAGAAPRRPSRRSTSWWTPFLGTTRTLTAQRGLAPRQRRLSRPVRLPAQTTLNGMRPPPVLFRRRSRRHRQSSRPPGRRRRASSRWTLRSSGQRPGPVRVTALPRPWTSRPPQLRPLATAAQLRLRPWKMASQRCSLRTDRLHLAKYFTKCGT